MIRLQKSLVALCGMLALLLGTASLVSAQQGGRWVRERVQERLEEADARAEMNLINSGGRGGYTKNAAIVADSTVAGKFAVEADVYRAAELPTIVKTGDLVSQGPNKKDVVRYTVNLTPGARYVIQLTSGTGATRDSKALPGFFDSVLMVEDSTGRVLASNDDINWPTNCNALVTIDVPASGVVRIVVTSYRNGEWGPFTVTMMPQQ